LLPPPSLCGFKTNESGEAMAFETMAEVLGSCVQGQELCELAPDASKGFAGDLCKLLTERQPR